MTNDNLVIELLTSLDDISDEQREGLRLEATNELHKARRAAEGAKAAVDEAASMVKFVHQTQQQHGSCNPEECEAARTLQHEGFRNHVQQVTHVLSCAVHVLHYMEGRAQGLERLLNEQLNEGGDHGNSH